MLSLRTTDNWVFDVEVVAPDGGGAPATDTYSNPATVTSAYEAASAFVAWANDAARPWFGAFTFALQFRRRFGIGDGVFEVAVTGGYVQWTPDANANLLLGWDADHGDVIYSISPAAGCWYPAGIGLRTYLRHLRGDGDGSGVGTLRPGVSGLAARKPTIDAVATCQQAAFLTQLLATAATPRRGFLWAVQDQAWRPLTFGAFRMQDVDPLLTRVDCEVVG